MDRAVRVRSAVLSIFFWFLHAGLRRSLAFFRDRSQKKQVSLLCSGFRPAGRRRLSAPNIEIESGFHPAEKRSQSRRRSMFPCAATLRSPAKRNSGPREKGAQRGMTSSALLLLRTPRGPLWSGQSILLRRVENGAKHGNMLLLTTASLLIICAHRFGQGVKNSSYTIFVINVIETSKNSGRT